jgi:hypothetical protein
MIVEAEAEKNKNKKLSEILGDSSPVSLAINRNGPSSQLSFAFFLFPITSPSPALS